MTHIYKSTGMTKKINVQKGEKLVLLPHYIGSLKYFEKLLPTLKDTYRVQFLFIPRTEKEHFAKEMIEYSTAKGYPYSLITRLRVPLWVKRIPVLADILILLDGRRKFRRFLDDSQLQKIICVNDKSPYLNLLFWEAKKRGVQTLLLQWATSTVKGEDKNTKPTSLRAKVYDGLFYFLLKHLLQCPYRKNRTVGRGLIENFGVFNQQSYDTFRNAGVPEEKLTIVGSADFDRAYQTLALLTKNVGARNAAAEDYAIDTKKTNIAIFSTPFYTKDITILSKQEQLAYFSHIIDIIRSVFSESEADILFKIHPAEDITLYGPLSHRGVKLYDKHTENEKLIFFAHLYICHHSTTNLIPIAMGKDVILLNLLKLKLAKGIEECFSIKKFIDDEREFRQLLADFKRGTLHKQYENPERLFTENSLANIMSWISYH